MIENKYSLLSKGNYLQYFVLGNNNPLSAALIPPLKGDKNLPFMRIRLYLYKIF